uniref:TF-B3 domain-containing protein n=1 Tax=Setaria viridis TaxID=4556 RepID=A0A4U6UHT3_SETVI|nr:hypothetical protein SEVIR_5G201500v2 [Setaria viridis]
MEGSSRSARATAAAATKQKKKKQKNGRPAVPPRDVVPFDRVRGGISGALRDRLAALGATEPSYLAGKTLKMSDVLKNQARLLFSCKGESLPRCPLTACLTEREERYVWDDKGGLLVTALDRGGRSYDLTCRYLVSNYGYRFITEWKKLVGENGLRQGMRVELWAFRSPQLPNRYETRDGGKKVAVREEIGHPDGSLGMVVLQYDDESDPERGDDELGEVVPVQETGTTGQMKSEAAAPEEKLIASGGAACAEPAVTTEGMVERFEVRIFLAAIGLVMLKRRYNET